MKKRHTWTEEQIRYIKRIAKGNKKKTILEKVNKKFNLNNLVTHSFSTLRV